MTIKELKIIYLMGECISFEITNHPRIPNTVKVNGSIIGNASISTINSFNKWKLTL